jgi:pyrimidine-specific ribonucleoside hydrolase
VIIDTDPGVDDAVALMLAVASPELDLRAVTTVFGNVGLERTTPNALRVLALAGAPHVPVATGAARPLVHPQGERAGDWHGEDGLGGRSAELPPPSRQPEQRVAVELMVDVLRASEAPVTLVPIGPLTNVALLLATHPELRPRIARLVVMGGALAGGNTTGAAEFNIHSDPEAARRVLVEEPLPTTLVPLDLTMRCAVDDAWLAALAAAGPRCAALAGTIAHYRARYSIVYGRDDVALHDSLAVLEAAVPGTLRTTPLPLEVVCDQGPARGAVLADRRRDAPGRIVDVALDADVHAVSTTILDRLRTLG